MQKTEKLPIKGIRCFCYSRFHKLLFCVNNQQELVIFDVERSKQQTYDLGHGFWHGCIACHPHRPVVAISFGWNLWQMFDWKVGQTEQICQDFGHYKHFSFSQTGDLAFAKNSIVLFLPDGASEATRVGFHNSVSVINICSSENMIVTGGWDSKIIIWFLFEHLGWAKIRELYTGGTVYFADFDAQNRLITQSYDQPLVLWDENLFDFTYGAEQEIKRQLMSFASDSQTLCAKGVPIYCDELESYITHATKLNDWEVVFLDNYRCLYISRKLPSKENILAANFALAKHGLNRDVRDVIFQFLNVLDDNFCLQKMYNEKI